MVAGSVRHALRERADPLALGKIDSDPLRHRMYQSGGNMYFTSVIQALTVR